MAATDGFWAFDDCTAYPLPENRVLVRNARNGNQAILTPDVYHALAGCREFKPLEDHARHLASTNPALAGQEAAILQVLESVRSDGLLVSADLYPALFHPRPQPAELTDKPVAAVITWERPEALARCLESVLEHCDLERVERFHVIDDSRTDSIQQQNRAATEQFAERAPIPAYYVGAREQEQFLQRIISKARPYEEAIRFLVDRDRWSQYWTSGLGRTVALLLSVGKRLLVLDDDVLCEVFEPYSTTGEASFADSGREAAFFSDPEQWQGFRAEQGRDPFVRHLRLLGLGLEDCLGALKLDRLQPRFFAGAQPGALEPLHADSPVLVTECGSLGDPGTSMSNWLTGLESTSMQRLLESEESVTNALDVRCCWNGRSTSHFGQHANMSQLTGLDNRHLLPPYIPIMRGEDRLFGSMVEFLHPGSITLDMAWAIPHLPIPERRWTAENRAFNIEEPFPRFSMFLVDDHLDASNSRDPVRRLGHMARLYEDLAEMDGEQLRRHYLHKRLDAMADRYNHLKTVRQRQSDAPQVWLDYLDDALARLNQELVNNPPNLPLRGYPENLDNDALVAWWRDFWKRFAHALRSWPAIRQAARDCTP